ncbi:bifunctional diaminohydroxyphosphoribosylaminopyrimidine deaminase/5-amino-6-(5-phosphoribosylamino)uracil reductase RibD [Brenneria corticis]|uniref:Riboflavin biosynthesis protein RibD n=1 Tax=Brenneria corticis TaxID=2173106 RepID=A0A2U1UA28_9GAMM|nr:bifunctional diaminohydroxyphosphoribosylaminopyrimidine deaminase/5-amino-6-(5-phosphoribosylamino)uracil reductase RibD [Brenneria sp. CFCC 11842]PWC18511.1 bifunctional diaminohydroxyphosphoribosylaminopyrimidine deaminase/5-amino-6-(5-phosphoribosylamino)uracil reductase RibD [Brenneria sp. CFCC 11842]
MVGPQGELTLPQDETYMARALELARRGRFTTAPNPNVGCVIVRDGEVVGEGYHFRAGEPHAEVYALRMAGERARGATAYVTLEPCSHHGRTPPCADALAAAGVSRVVVAMQDPNPQVAGRGLHRLQQAGIAVSHGLMAAEAEKLNRGFLKRMRTGFPYVQLKMAASLDGRTAMASGESQWITSPQARRDVQRFRAQSAAILSSGATVLADDPSLTVRWRELDADTQRSYAAEDLRQPVRVIVDGRQRVTPQHRIIAQPGQTWLARTRSDERTWPETVEQLSLPQHDGGIDLVALMMVLGKRQINAVWVEAGATLAGALLKAGVVDELIVYLAPKLLGDNARGLCVLPGLSRLSQAPEFEISDVRQVGPDLRLRLKPRNGSSGA